MLPYRLFVRRGAAIALLVCASAATAEDRSAPVPPSPDPFSISEAPIKPIIDIGRPVDPGRLAGLRGGADIAESTILIDGVVDDNTANQIVTGSNSISDGAFANANGLNTVIQNTGANVLIQYATIVQVEFVDSGP